MIKHTIHHYEDEPELLKWIPGVLFNSYCLHYHDCVKDGGNYREHEDETRSTTFELTVDGQRHLVEYRVYNGIDEFREQFRPAPGDLALIDLMEGGVEPVGREAYQMAVDALGPDAPVYVLTAFAGAADDVPKERVLSKPIDDIALVDILVAGLAIGGAS